MFDYPELLTVAETAEVLEVAPEYVEAGVIAGDLPAKQFGGVWRDPSRAQGDIVREVQ